MAGALFRLRALAPALLCVAALLTLAPAALANTYRPTRTGDPTPNGCHPHNCSLREAIIKANHHHGADKVVLKGGKTYRLAIPPVFPDGETTGDLNLTDNLKIVSSDTKLATIDGEGIDGVINSGPTAPVSATLSRLKIRGGIGSGISLVNGALALSRSVVSGNTGSFGAGIDNASGTTLTVSRSRVTANHASSAGGGMGTRGTVVVSRSTISGNTAMNGAGILIGDTTLALTVKNSTIAKNHATGDGGAMNVDSSPARLINDTIANNQADGNGGGIADSNGTVNMNAVTVARNSAAVRGGGLYENMGTINFKNTLLGLNTAANMGPNCYGNITGVIASGGHNLMGDTSGCAWTMNGTDRINRSASQIMIGQLANNGGPTKTIALKPGSQAINHAGSDAPPRDQRGVKRDSKPDIGAFERR